MTVNNYDNKVIVAGMYNDEVHPFHMKLGGGNHEPAISVSYQSIDSISTYLPIHFLGIATE